MKQASPFDKDALATPWYGGSNLGTRIDNESTIPATLQFRYNFEDEIILRGGGGGGGGGGGSCNTPNYTLLVLPHV